MTIAMTTHAAKTPSPIYNFLREFNRLCGGGASSSSTAGIGPEYFGACGYNGIVEDLGSNSYDRRLLILYNGYWVYNRRVVKNKAHDRTMNNVTMNDRQ